MGEAHTSREALIAQMLGELDSLLARAETLPLAIAEAEARVANTTAALNVASDKYRMAVTAFTEQARIELTEHLQRKAIETVTRTVEDQRAAMHDAARRALDIEFAKRPDLSQRSDQIARLAGIRVLEHCLIALSTAGLTALFVCWLIRTN